MTPGARVQAAIEIVEMILAGQATEAALLSWTRSHRFAGSKDRAALRDLVFSVRRRWRSSAYLGGGSSARQRVIGALQADGADLGALFSGEGYAPAPLRNEEHAALNGLPRSAAEKYDLPEWLWPEWSNSLGEKAEAIAQNLQERAGVFCRVNRRKADRSQVIEALCQDSITAEAHPTVPTAVTVLEGARKLSSSQAYREGMIELQDAESQAVIEQIPGGAYRHILDYCAGGGGKTLALADRFDADLHAHDINHKRMSDIPNRAKRAGVTVACLAEYQLRRAYDLVLCDVPCSGAGAWRRSPDGKWDLDAAGLERLIATQRSVFLQARERLAPGGVLVYVTCSVLRCENHLQTAYFCETCPSLTLQTEYQTLPSALGDGFYMALYRQSTDHCS